MIESIEYTDPKLNIIFIDDKYNRRAEIECTISNQELDIEIQRCSVSFQLKENEDKLVFLIGSIFKLNKNTKYRFENDEIHIKVGGPKIIIFFDTLFIKFSGYTQKYTWVREDTGPVRFTLESTDIISNFENFGGEIVAENDPDAPVKTEEKVEVDPAEEDQVEKDPVKEDPEKTELEEEKDLEPDHEDLDEENSKKRFTIQFLPYMYWCNYRGSNNCSADLLLHTSLAQQYINLIKTKITIMPRK
ncbi:hypothetical protein RF11_09866 [Thelohanellus kitauei]|uniref:Uncharacterized protein n=1 Tax=Thelohanellus kitauei TaxID=669202 RepID=A0A0C2N590_THEKT|nr:hypothetical protein RF11_09866 [Thelohanellus kitauei]